MINSLRRAVPMAVALAVAVQSSAFAAQVFTTNGVAIQGYDPVAYFTDKKPVKGTKTFTTSYQGATFYFASAAHRDAFQAEPERYAPQYGGYCAFGVAEGHKATTEPQAFTVINGKLYLNYNNDVMKTWRKDIPGYVEKANGKWKEVRQQAEP